MQNNSLRHIAIIMDGNGRWAQNRGLNRTSGHKEGVKVVEKISIWCAKNNIEFLSLYAFSTENWLRPKAEVSFLMKLLLEYLKSQQQTYIINNIKFKAIGDLSAFSTKLKNQIKILEELTSSNTALTQILALNYGAKDELSRALLKAIQSNKPTSKNEAMELLESNLDTVGIPEVDLLIRTGGEKRLSNFMLYQSAYAELSFSNTLFPDFTTVELQQIINDFNRRNRRFGRL